MQDPQETKQRQQRLAELERIIEIQIERNSGLTEETAEALIQQYLAEDRRARGNHNRVEEPRQDS